MKYLRKIIQFFIKSIALGLCGVISLQFFIPFFPLILESMHPFQYGSWIYIYYSPMKSIIGFTLCLAFGVPSIFIIDRWFGSYPLRYIVGGAISATIAWAIINGETSSTGSIFNALGRINWHLGLFFMAYGILTGTLYTLLLWIFTKTQKLD